ncbi:hypothetical protein B0H12DRAFT_1076653 [Mycena haematopus]|nr:hypothetical protein B0H12DRAFT_1076653 [Mycena haematopus]
MAVDTRYTVEQAALWPQYQNRTLAWANGRGPYPGPPPVGYLESYKLRNPTALLPENFPDLLAVHRQGRGPAPAAPAIPAVALTENALGMIVGMSQTFANTLGGMVMAANNQAQFRQPQMMARAVVRGRTMMGGGRRFNQRKQDRNYRNYRLYNERGGRGRRGQNGGPGKRQEPLNLKDRVSEPASDVATRGNSPVPDDDIFGELDVVVEEDIHMDDFDHIKDEEEVGWDGGEPVPAM